MTGIQIKILEKGLKFTPTPQPNNIELKKDIRDFTRKLRLLEYFSDTDNENDDDSILKNKSNFCPGRNLNNTLDKIIDSLNQEELETTKKSTSNLSKQEWLALKELQSDKTIIIKEADKGGAVVIMN